MAENARRKDQDEQTQSNTRPEKRAANTNRQPANGSNVVPLRDASYYDEDQMIERKESAYQPSEKELRQREASLKSDSYTWYENEEGNRNTAPGENAVDKSTSENPSTSQTFIAEQQERGTDPRREYSESEKQLQKEQQIAEQEAEAEERAYQKYIRQRQRAVQKKVIQKAQTMAVGTIGGKTTARLRVRAVNRMALWGIIPFVPLQIYLGIMILFMFGFTAAVDATWFGRAANTAVEWFVWAVSFGEGSASFTDVLMGFGAVAWFAIIGMAVLQFAIMSIVYLFIGAHPFNSHFKFMMFLFAFVGYCIPFSNMLPCIIVWMLAVQIEPK